MISTLKKKNKIKRELLSKIEWACSLNAIKLEHEMIFEGCPKNYRTYKLSVCKTT